MVLGRGWRSEWASGTLPAATTLPSGLPEGARVPARRAPSPETESASPAPRPYSAGSLGAGRAGRGPRPRGGEGAGVPRAALVRPPCSPGARRPRTPARQRPAGGRELATQPELDGSRARAGFKDQAVKWLRAEREPPRPALPAREVGAGPARSRGRPRARRPARVLFPAIRSCGGLRRLESLGARSLVAHA